MKKGTYGTCLRENENLVCSRAQLEGNLSSLCKCLRSIALAKEREIVRSRDAQCSTKELR